MAALRLTQAFCLVYIMVSVPTLANCARVKVGRDMDLATQGQRTETDVHGHKWCNPFSFNTVKRYHFDVQLSDKNCTDGACVAIELVRDLTKPRLVLHGGKQWTVHKVPEPTSEGILQWDLYAPGPSKTPDKQEINLFDVDSISFFAAELGKPEKVEIIYNGKTNGTESSRNVFDLEGGLYYNEKFLQQGYDEVTAVELKKLQKSASESSTVQNGAKIGALYKYAPLFAAAEAYLKNAGGAFAGYYLQQALLGAIAGPIVGAITGGIVGTAMTMGGYDTVKGYTIKSASSKVFEKLRCMSAFKTCSDHVLVPMDKPCPRR